MSRLNRLDERLRLQLAPPTRLYLPFVVHGAIVGSVRSDFAEALREWPQHLVVADGRVIPRPQLAGRPQLEAAFAEIARGLAERGLLTAWRDETYRVATGFAEPPLFVLERAAARFFGIRTYAVHVNGVVGTGKRQRMWLARRSPRKPIDPGKLDNLVGGGLASGASVRDTLLKEAWEEAGIAPALAARAAPAGLLHVRREVPDGLQVETIFVHDLTLPASFVPTNQDGEAVEHRLCTQDEVLRIAGDPDAATVDATLVAIDYFARHGALHPDEPGYFPILCRLRGGAG